MGVRSEVESEAWVGERVKGRAFGFVVARA